MRGLVLLSLLALAGCRDERLRVGVGVQRANATPSYGTPTVGAPCNEPKEFVVIPSTTDGGPLPTDGTLYPQAARSVTLCNSVRNSSAIFTITIDGTAPVASLAAAGQDIQPGDCEVINVSSGPSVTKIAVISDTADAGLKGTACK
jgi:hypothetical protein